MVLAIDFADWQWATKYFNATSLKHPVMYCMHVVAKITDLNSHAIIAQCTAAGLLQLVHNATNLTSSEVQTIH